MKKYIALLILFNFSIVNFSFSQEKAIDLTRGNTINKKIKLFFNEAAVKEKEYVVFEINDDFDFDNLTLLVNGKKITESTLKIYAKKRDTIINIDFFAKDNAESGTYYFSGKISESSEALKGNISYKNKAFKRYVYKVPESFTESLIKYGTYGLIGAVTFLLTFLLVRQNQKFKRGILSLKHPYREEFHLKNYARKFSYSDVVDKETSTDFYLIKGHNGNPKIFTSQDNVMIEVNNEVVKEGYVLRTEDEVIVSDDNNNYIKFIYN